MKTLIKICARTIFTSIVVLSIFSFASCDEEEITESIGTTYYVSSSSGSDSNDGLSESTAFQSISKVNALSLTAGDSVLFKKGDTFQGNLVLSGLAATSSNPIIFADYGSESAKPILTNQNSGGHVFKLVNSSNVYIKNLEFHVYGDVRSDTSSECDAILITYYHTNGAEYSGITILGNTIIGYGNSCDAVNSNTMGVVISSVDQSLSCSKSNVLSDCTVSNNTIYNVGRSGIHSIGWLETEARQDVSQSKFSNFYFNANTVHDVGCIGIYISNCTTSTIQNNTVYKAGTSTLGRTDEGECGIMALASITCDISGNTVYQTGDQGAGYDAMGIDIDWFTSGIDVHHNKIYENEGSGVSTMCCVDCNIRNNTIYDNLCSTNNTSDIYVTNYTATNSESLGITGDYLTVKNLVVQNNTITHSVGNGHVFETCTEAANPNGESENISTTGTSFKNNTVKLTLTDTEEITDFCWINFKSQNNHSTYLLWNEFTANSYKALSQAVTSNYFVAVNPGLSPSDYSTFTSWEEACDTDSTFSENEE